MTLGKKVSILFGAVRATTSDEINDLAAKLGQDLFWVMRPSISGEMLQPFGAVENYWEHTGSVDINSGLMKATGNAGDRFFFRVPLLRNIEKPIPVSTAVREPIFAVRVT